MRANKGPKQDCLAYIKEVWTDMRPLSLRKKMEAMAAGQHPDAVAALGQDEDDDNAKQ